MNSKKPCLNLLSLIEQPKLKSIGEIRQITVGIAINSENTNEFVGESNSEKKELASEKTKSISEVLSSWYKSLLKKKKILEFKRFVAEQALHLANIVDSYYLSYMKQGKTVKAYQILGLLEKLTGKNNLKFPQKNKFRTRLIIYTGYFYLKEKKFNAALEFFEKSTQIASKNKFRYEKIIGSSMAAYAACKLLNHKLAIQLNLENLQTINATDEHCQFYALTNIVTLYNLAADSLHLYMRKDAEYYIGLSQGILENLENYVLLKNKVAWLADELLDHEIQPREEVLEESTSVGYNFLPGGIAEENGKLVKIDRDP